MPLLEKAEFMTIMGALGDAVMISTGVARLYKGQKNQWNYTKIMGAVCLCEQAGAVYFKIVELKSGRCAWEQELYENFEYNKTSSFFHTFEINDCVAGFSFADEDEASKFYQTVQNKIPRAGGSRNTAPPRQLSIQREDSTKDMKDMTKKKKEKSASGGFLSGLFGTKKEAEVSISGPENFRHESHIGWDPEHGFEIRNIPPQWRKLFQAAGIKKSDLKDADTVKFVMETISQNLPPGTAPPMMGGAAPPAPPKRTGPAPPPPATTRAPPPPTTRGAAPPPPSRGGAPPPPTTRGDAPPPPPPPPGPGAPPPRGPPAPAAPVYEESYEQYEEEDNGSDSRGGLLAQIRQGTSLKKAEERSSELPELDQQTSDNLASILASAMAARRVDMKLKPAPGEDGEEGDEDGWSD